MSQSSFVWVSNLSQGKGPKVNPITLLEFEPAYIEAPVQYINHYATGIDTSA